uniref:Retrotransposon gag domain-containing protein n=1 Tax=Chromera velia CCMP2878 TaxID=1169474 RepID=A0A0G4H9U5_9ALVE|eukprot:Cvel_896.t1-p1 / transcript=Cvel_896.t1 / gene=Cvel_896 / organism=Chromera_velia_CCMP2878 / gene_product=hypothetical protein / transcript_product=hypothetical protein / location=Cvel_scaffold28:81446-96494(+) / protein_length=838 / sequence_SO=supercontig / SO=protein_coding / is_pseudo=false
MHQRERNLLIHGYANVQEGNHPFKRAGRVCLVLAVEGLGLSHTPDADPFVLLRTERISVETRKLGDDAARDLQESEGIPFLEFDREFLLSNSSTMILFTPLCFERTISEEEVELSLVMMASKELRNVSEKWSEVTEEQRMKVWSSLQKLDEKWEVPKPLLQNGGISTVTRTQMALLWTRHQDTTALQGGAAAQPAQPEGQSSCAALQGSTDLLCPPAIAVNPVSSISPVPLSMSTGGGMYAGLGVHIFRHPDRKRTIFVHLDGDGQAVVLEPVKKAKKDKPKTDSTSASVAAAPGGSDLDGSEPNNDDEGDPPEVVGSNNNTWWTYNGPHPRRVTFTKETDNKAKRIAAPTRETTNPGLSESLRRCAGHLPNPTVKADTLTFSGERQKAQEFWTSFKADAHVHKWDMIETRYYFHKALRGVAATDENIRAYVERMSNICREAKIDEDNLKVMKRFCKGIFNKIVRTVLTTETHTTFDSLVTSTEKLAQANTTSARNSTTRVSSATAHVPEWKPDYNRAYNPNPAAPIPDSSQPLPRDFLDALDNLIKVGSLQSSFCRKCAGTRPHFGNMCTVRYEDRCFKYGEREHLAPAYVHPRSYISPDPAVRALVQQCRRIREKQQQQLSEQQQLSNRARPLNYRDLELEPPTMQRVRNPFQNHATPNMNGGQPLCLCQREGVKLKGLEPGRLQTTQTAQTAQVSAAAAENRPFDPPDDQPNTTEDHTEFFGGMASPVPLMHKYAYAFRNDLVPNDVSIPDLLGGLAPGTWEYNWYPLLQMCLMSEKPLPLRPVIDPTTHLPYVPRPDPPTSKLKQQQQKRHPQPPDPTARRGPLGAPRVANVSL